MEDYRRICVENYNNWSFNKKAFSVNLTFIKSKTTYDLTRRFKVTYPLKVAEFVSNLPLIGTPNLRKTVQ